MPGTDGTVGVASPAVPTAYIDNQQMGTYLGLPLERQRVSSFEATGLIPTVYDAIALTYNLDGTIATATYSASGVTVATLTLGYTSGALTSIARTDVPSYTLNPFTGNLDAVGTSTPTGTTNVVAAGSIPALHVVALNSSGLAYVADVGTLTDASRILGVSLVSATIGNSLTVQIEGWLDTGGPTFTVGPLYLGTAGALISTPPGAGAFQFQIAAAVTATRLIVRPLFPILT